MYSHNFNVLKVSYYWHLVINGLNTYLTYVIFSRRHKTCVKCYVRIMKKKKIKTTLFYYTVVYLYCIVLPIIIDHTYKIKQNTIITYYLLNSGGAFVYLRRAVVLKEYYQMTQVGAT